MNRTYIYSGKHAGFWFDGDSCNRFSLYRTSDSLNFYPEELINTRKGNWIVIYTEEEYTDLPPIAKIVSEEEAEEILKKHGYHNSLDGLKIEPEKEI